MSFAAEEPYEEDPELSEALNNLSDYELAIYRWTLQRRTAQTAPAPLPLIWVLLGGRGCVAAGTKIWNPVTAQHQAVEDRTTPGYVLALGSNGSQRPVLATQSYLKGHAALYEVRTARTATEGAVQVTLEHQFLTRKAPNQAPRWVRLRDIDVGDEIAWGSPIASPEDAQRYTERDEGFQGGCRQPLRLYDRQLPQALGNATPELPSRGDVLAHIQQPLRTRDYSPSQERSHFCQLSDHRPRSSCELGELYQANEQSHAQPCVPESLLQGSRGLQQSHGKNARQDRIQEPSFVCQQRYEPDAWESSLVGSGYELPTQLAGASELGETCQLEHRPRQGLAQIDIGRRLGGGVASCVVPYLNHTKWTRVLSISPLHGGVPQPFYDLTVPRYHNYLAEGLWHHNSGKTFTAANHTFELACNLPHTPKNRIVRVALIGETFGDVKSTMIEGSTGLRNIIPRSCEIAWNRSIGELMVAIRPSPSSPHYREIHFFSYTSERPDQLRGPEHHLAWLDEPAKLKDNDEDPESQGTTWNNLMLGLRAGQNPHVVVSGTPRPCHLVKYLVAHPNAVTARMSTWDNRANLPAAYVKELERMPPNSRMARQEIYAEILMDNPDALFDQETIDAHRALPPFTDLTQQAAQGFKRVLGYDPAPSSGEDSDEAGIVTATYGPLGEETHAYIEADLSGHYTPKEQTALVIKTTLDPLKPVDILLFEQNQGVDFVMDALLAALSEQTKTHSMRKMKPPRTDYGVVKRFKVTATRDDDSIHTFMILAIHATKGKQIRAELASARYETGQVHHPVEPQALPTCLKSSCKTSLESQMTSWNPTKNQASPDRLDSLAYCVIYVFGQAARTNTGPSSLAGPGPEPLLTQTLERPELTPQKKEPRGIELWSVDMMESHVLPYE